MASLRSMTTKEIVAKDKMDSQENAMVNGEQTADSEPRDEKEGNSPAPCAVDIKPEGERWVNMPACGPGSIREAACERRVLLLRGLPASVKAQGIADAYESQPNAPRLVNIQFAGDEHWYLIFVDEDSARKANFILNYDIKSVMGHKIRVCFKHSVPVASQRPDMSDGFYGPYGGSAPASHVPSPTPSFPQFFLPHQSGDVFQQPVTSDSQQLLVSNAAAAFSPIQLSPQLATPVTIGVNPAILTSALLSQQQLSIQQLLQDAVSMGTSSAQFLHPMQPAPLNGLTLASVLGISPVGHFPLLAAGGHAQCPSSHHHHQQQQQQLILNQAMHLLSHQQQQQRMQPRMHRHDCPRQTRNGAEHPAQPVDALLYESSSQQPSDYLECGGTFTRRSLCTDEAGEFYEENGMDLLESKVFTPSQTTRYRNDYRRHQTRNALPPRFGGDARAQTSGFNTRMQSLVNSYQGIGEPRGEPVQLASSEQPIRDQGFQREAKHTRPDAQLTQKCTPERQMTVVSEAVGSSLEEEMPAKKDPEGTKSLTLASSLPDPLYRQPSVTNSTPSWADTLKRGPVGSLGNQPPSSGRPQQPQRRLGSGSVHRRIDSRQPPRPIQKDGGRSYR